VAKSEDWKTRSISEGRCFVPRSLAVDVAVTVLVLSAQRRRLFGEKKIHVGTKLSATYADPRPSLIKVRSIFNSDHSYDRQPVNGMGSLIRTAPNASSDAVAQFLCA
jgi:hypothetical protein